MLRTAAVQRIQRGLGFITNQADTIALALQEAQRDLEKGKTLPKFLLVEGAALTLLATESTVDLPADFRRLSDEKLRYTLAGESTPNFIEWRRDYDAALEANFTGEGGGPKVAVLRSTYIDFINPADVTYNFVWSYYKKGALLTTDIENEWLADDAGSKWLIGEAGYLMAQDKRDKDGMAIFNTMRTQGRAACFGDDLASDDAAGALYLGEDV